MSSQYEICLAFELTLKFSENLWTSDLWTSDLLTSDLNRYLSLCSSVSQSVIFFLFLWKPITNFCLIRYYEYMALVDGRGMRISVGSRVLSRSLWPRGLKRGSVSARLLGL